MSLLLTAVACRIGGGVSNSSLYPTSDLLKEWDFSNTSDYAFDSTRIRVAASRATLLGVPQVDLDGSSLGFGGGTLSGAGFECLNNGLVFQGTGTPLAFPDGAATGGWLNMTGNILLAHMDETTWTSGAVADSSGAGNAGTAVGASPVCGGKTGRAGAFDGTTSYLDFGNLGIGTTPGASISAWIYLSSTPGTDGHEYVIAAKSSNGHDFDLQIETDNKVHFHVTITSSGNQEVVSSTALMPGRWYHVVATYQASIALKLYLDGALSGTQAITNNWNGNSNTFRIGNSALWPSPPGGRFFKGLIDEVAVWNRVLSGAEVTTVYTTQSNLPALSGQFTSRVIDAGTSVAWNTLGWSSLRPYGKALPNGGHSESGYSGQTLSMSGNVFLAHLDESSWGSVVDSSANGFNGTASNATPGAAGKFGGAGSFNGTTSHLDFGNAPFSSATAASISVWVKPTALPTATQIATLVGKSAFSKDFDLQIEDDGKVHWYVYTTGVNNLASATVIPTGQWTHIVATYVQGNPGTLKLYLNGVLSSSTTIGIFPWVGNTATLSLGNNNTATRPYNGLLDEVGIWNRALGDDEVADLYLRGANAVKFQVRSCASSSCSDGVFGGPDGGGSTYFTEQADLTPPADRSFTQASNRYFQYRAFYTTDAATVSPELTNVTVGPSHFDASVPSIATSSPVTYSQLTGFTETVVAGTTGATRYQLSADGTTWYNVVSGVWTTATTAAQSSPAADINAVIGTFAARAGGHTLYVKAFFVSDGTQSVTLKSLDVTGTK